MRPPRRTQPSTHHSFLAPSHCLSHASCCARASCCASWSCIPLGLLRGLSSGGGATSPELHESWRGNDQFWPEPGWLRHEVARVRPSCTKAGQASSKGQPRPTCPDFDRTCPEFTKAGRPTSPRCFAEFDPLWPDLDQVRPSSTKLTQAVEQRCRARPGPEVGSGSRSEFRPKIGTQGSDFDEHYCFRLEVWRGHIVFQGPEPVWGGVRPDGPGPIKFRFLATTRAGERQSSSNSKPCSAHFRPNLPTTPDLGPAVPRLCAAPWSVAPPDLWLSYVRAMYL